MQRERIVSESEGMGSGGRCEGMLRECREEGKFGSIGREEEINEVDDVLYVPRR